MKMHILAAVLSIGLAAPAVADDALPQPTGDVALTISGAIANPNDGSDVRLDLAGVKGIGGAEIVTTTDWDWHEGPQTFSGTPAVKLLEAAGLNGKTITVVAADEYQVEMSVDDLKRHGAIIATALNGEALTDESFGPLWLVFPYDKMASEAEREAYTARSVWSIVSIKVQ